MSKVWTPDGSTMILLDKKFPQTEGGEMRVCGHVHFGSFPSVGEDARVEGKEGGIHFFRFVSVEPCSDPRAMYFASIKRYKVEYDGEIIWQEDAPDQMNHYSRTQTWKGMAGLFVISCTVLFLADKLGWLG